jgi:hypothetical protein
MNKLLSDSRSEPMKVPDVKTSKHIARRDRMTREIASALSFADETSSQWDWLVARPEPNLIEITASNGTIYTLRVSQKRSQP